MASLAEYERYMSRLCEKFGHADRRAGFMAHGRGLMLPIERKSVEPLAAYTDPWHVSAKHQSLHRMEAKSAWSDEAVLTGVREWVGPALKLEKGCYWIVDDTGFPKKGEHSVGVERHYCGQLGKQDNCQVEVSISLASAQGSLPIAFRRILPEEWAGDRARREKAGVPGEIRFATKPQTALEQVRAAKAADVPVGVVLGDTGYGNGIEFRDGVRELGLKYCVGCSRARQCGRETWRRCHRSRRRISEVVPPLGCVALRVRASHQGRFRSELREEEWLVIEWSSEPVHYWLSNPPANTTLRTRVSTAMTRWRLERDYQELKQEFGLSHYEGRGWRGFHHLATLCIAARGFLVSERLKGGGSKKTPLNQKRLSYPKTTRRAAAGRMQRHVPDSIPTLRHPLARAIAQRLDRRPFCALPITKRTL